MIYPPAKMIDTFPAAEPSILEELRNRKVTNSKDMYYGTVGIFGHGSSTRKSIFTPCIEDSAPA